ncbi:MAG: glycosyltransferase [Chloroflexota bacterium]|nr:glycosyltransferase [Chloroflexota bacterium]
MINLQDPDYANTPASDCRPAFHYEPYQYDTPLLSIMTPYYNTGAVFQETVRSIQRMSFAHWEWIIVDDGSTTPESLAQLECLQAREPRVRVLHQANGGPAVVRNHAAREARGRYLMQLDSDDLIEPTFAEKALWVLETQPQFSACGAYDVSFGAKNYTWAHGFQEYEKSVAENMMTNHAVIQRDAFFAAGGYDERISYEHADWDFWLNMAEVGLWGYTIPEYLVWYRIQEKSLLMEIEGNKKRASAFRAWLQTKHQGLAERFPHPLWISSMDIPHASIPEKIPLRNSLGKPAAITRVLFLVPWLTIGGADKFNLDLMRSLSKCGYEFTIAATLRSTHPWLHEFTSITPDVFCLHQFLHYADYPRFLNYLIQSRQIDALLISNSELAYSLMPFLRAQHPNLAMLDYTHLEEDQWKNGGYPRMSVQAGTQLDLHITSTQYLKQWMAARGVDPEGIQVCHTNIDANEWSPQSYDSATIRKQLSIPAETPVILFVGRVTAQKRPLVFVKIMQELVARNPHCIALIVGDGEKLPAMKACVKKNSLEQHIRFMGALPNKQVREVMAVSDILLLPSASEGLALVLFECMAMEMVPVAADCGGHPELVTPECGFLIPQSEQEIAEYVRILHQLLANPQQRQEMARNARQRISEHFDLQEMAAGMEEAFRQARQHARTRPSTTGDLALAYQTAHIAIEYMRMTELAEWLWSERATIPLWQAARRVREALLPIGSQRYNVYKRFRQALRWSGRLVRRINARFSGRPQQPAAGVIQQLEVSTNEDEHIPIPVSSAR